MVLNFSKYLMHIFILNMLKVLLLHKTDNHILNYPSFYITAVISLNESHNAPNDVQF